MLALNGEARRLTIRTSGNLVRRLKKIAQEIAQEDGAPEVTSDHVILAIH